MATIDILLRIVLLFTAALNAGMCVWSWRVAVEYRRKLRELEEFWDRVEEILVPPSALSDEGVDELARAMAERTHEGRWSM